MFTPGCRLEVLGEGRCVKGVHDQPALLEISLLEIKTEVG